MSITASLGSFFVFPLVWSFAIVLFTEGWQGKIGSRDGKGSSVFMLTGSPSPVLLHEKAYFSPVSDSNGRYAAYFEKIGRKRRVLNCILM